MLGQLLHSFKNPGRRTAPRPQTLESSTEELHTKGLLFPDSAFLRDTQAVTLLPPTSPGLQSASPQIDWVTDCSHGDFDLKFPRDIRVLVAQAECASLQAVLIFDSKLSTTAESPRLRHARVASGSEPNNPHHSRTASGPSRQYGKPPAVESIPENAGRESPALHASSLAAARSRFRRASMSATQSSEESAPSRQKAPDEIVNIALDCAFENVPTTYKGISNKIHIVPLEQKPFDNTMYNTLGNPFRGSKSRRPSGLSASFSASDPPVSPRKDTAAVEELLLPEHRRRTVLITRTFSVNWTEDDALATTTGTATETENQAFSHASTSKLPAPQIRPIQKRQTPKPPMYAISVVLQLPVASNESPPPSRSGMRRKGSGNTTAPTSLGSSFDSERRSGWTMIDPLSGMDSSALASDVDDRVDLIGQHWDIIVRTASALQIIVEDKILQLLRPLPLKGRPPKLLHLALAQDPDLKKAADLASERIIRGIKIPRVRTGQGRWGIWREEARWLDKWVGGSQRTMFFFYLITAFLGTHTEWLNIVGPKKYRRRHRDQQGLTTTEDMSVPSRTIIVSTGTDKMAARRLVFLLAAFLPTNHQSRGDTSPLRPSTSASFRAYSESPPTQMPPSQRESLRRTVNRRGKHSPSWQGAQTPRVSAFTSGPDTPNDSIKTGTIRGPEDGVCSRRGSEARAIMKSQLVMTDVEPSSRKCSATTSATATPGNVVPVAHLVRSYSSELNFSARPSSRESLASENLMNALQRSNTGTNSSDSQPISRWGSLKSLWSTDSATRRDSSDYSDVFHSNDEGLGIVGLHSDHLRGKLQQMVDEVEREQSYGKNKHATPELSFPNVMSTSELLSPSLDAPPSPGMSMPIDVPLKVSVNQQDGILDVNFPFPGWGSPSTSPPNIGQHSGSSFGSFAHASILSSGARENNRPMNVAGVLGKLHPDFELQAVPPYTELLEDIKAAMKAEPLPLTLRIFPTAEPQEEWIDICTSLVVDTSTLTIKRIRFRRLVRFIPPPPPLPAAKPLPFLKSQYGNVYTDAQLTPVPTHVVLDEKFEESNVNDVDDALRETIERVLVQSSTTSTGQSNASSRSGSICGREGSTTAGEIAATIEVPHTMCKKMVIGALEQIATAVDRDRQDARKYGPTRLRTLDDEVESTLREGIKKWFDEVERNNRALETARREQERADKAAAQAAVESDDASTIRPTKRSIHTLQPKARESYVQKVESTPGEIDHENKTRSKDAKVVKARIAAIEKNDTTPSRQQQRQKQQQEQEYADIVLAAKALQSKQAALAAEEEGITKPVNTPNPSLLIPKSQAMPSAHFDMSAGPPGKPFAAKVEDLHHGI